MPAPQRPAWDLLSHTLKPHYPSHPGSKVQEENLMPIAVTGIKSLGGTPSLNLPTAKTTDSAADIRLYKKLNIRSKLEPCQKYKRPITSSQEVGWGMTSR